MRSLLLFSAIIFMAADTPKSPLSPDRVKRDLIGKKLHFANSPKELTDWTFDGGKQHKFYLEIQRTVIRDDRMQLQVQLKNYGC